MRYNRKAFGARCSSRLRAPLSRSGHLRRVEQPEVREQLVQQCGITVRKVLTNNVSCYRSHAFRDALDDVEHRWTRPYCPQTNGKAERFHRTLADEWAYARLCTSDTERCEQFPVWLHTYSHHRGHTALGGQPPAIRVPIRSSLQGLDDADLLLVEVDTAALMTTEMAVGCVSQLNRLHRAVTDPAAVATRAALITALTGSTSSHG